MCVLERAEVPRYKTCGGGLVGLSRDHAGIDLAPDADTLVVVNCAGRTRSIIGCQSLRNAGIPNRVVALKDGTMGWELAGYTCERGASRVARPSLGLPNGQRNRS